MKKQKTAEKEIALETVLTAAVQIPGVKVSRANFLTELFETEDDISLEKVLEFGPIEAKVSQERLHILAKKLILKRTSQSSVASFAAGIPGGLAIAATLPADVFQLFGMTLRLAQELSYLYGADDLWKNNQLDDEKVKSQLLLYCAVMFGVSGAAPGVRILSSQLAKKAVKKLPQKALTKGFWFPIVKKIAKAFGVKITKKTFAQGVAKAVPLLGGVVSGALNFISMMPMANRLRRVLEAAAFNYTEQDFEKDIIEIEQFSWEDEASGIQEVESSQ